MDIREKIRKRIERLEAQRECAEFFNERDSMRKYGFAIRELEKKTLEEPQDEAGGEMPRTRAYCGDMCPSCGGVIESRRVTHAISRFALYRLRTQISTTNAGARGLSCHD